MVRGSSADQRSANRRLSASFIARGRTQITPRDRIQISKTSSPQSHRQMRVRLQNLAQMHLAQDNDVVYTLTPDRSDQPFGKAVLPGRGWRGRLVPDANGAQSACDDPAIDPIPIADEVTRSLIPRKCLRYLTCNPFCRWICCDVDPDEVSAVEPDDDEGIEQVETDSWNNEQVHGGNVRRMVTKEGSPSLVS